MPLIAMFGKIFIDTFNKNLMIVSFGMILVYS